MTIKEYTNYIKKFKIKYNFGIGEDKGKMPIKYFKVALKRIFFKRNLKYINPQGEKELIDLIALNEKNKYLDITSGNLIITSGATQGIFICLTNIQPKIKKVMLFTPTYPLYFQLCEYFKLNYCECCLEKYNFDLTYEIFIKSIKKNVNLIIINTPNNPTGKSYRLEEINKILNYCKQNNIFVIIDQVYDKYDYLFQKNTFPIMDNVYYVKSFSKTFNMTGCRLGYVICHQDNIKSLIKLQNMMIVASSSLIQDIGISAIKEKEKKLFKKYIYNRNYLEKELSKNNIKHVEMEGTFYCFIDVRDFKMTSYDIAIDILKKQHVVVLPSQLFHQEGYLRISYACKYKTLKSGIDLLIKYFNSLQNNLIV